MARLIALGALLISMCCGCDDASTAPGDPRDATVGDVTVDEATIDQTVDATVIDAMVDATAPDGAFDMTPDAGPVGFERAPDTPARPEAIVDGTVHAIHPVGSMWVVEAADTVRVGSLTQPRILPRPGSVLGAAFIADRWLIATPDAVFIESEGDWARSQLTDSVLPTAMVSVDNTLWLLADGLMAWRNGTLSAIGDSTAPIAAGRWAGQAVVWQIDDAQVHAWHADGSGQRWSATLPTPIMQWRPAGEGLLARTANDIIRLDADGWHALPLPSVPEHFAGAAGNGWFLVEETLWQLRANQIRVRTDAPPVLDMYSEPSGAVLIRNAQGLFRIAPGPTLKLEGVPQDALIEDRVVITCTLSDPDAVVRVQARFDDAPWTVIEGPPWQVVIEPAELAPGAHTLRVQAEYDDGAETHADLEFSTPVPPTWHDDIEPIFTATCAQCHVPGGIAHALDTRAAWIAEFDLILDDLRDGRMPLGLPPLAPETIARIEQWGAEGYAE